MSADHDDFAVDHIPGVPEAPPVGEAILWQGRPVWSGIALRVFHIRKVAIYFSVFWTWVGLTTVWDGGSASQAMIDMTYALPVPLAGLAILALLARLYERTTIYTITSKRVLMRIGIALPMTVNFPFNKVSDVNVRLCNDGSGDIPLVMTGPDKLAYIHLWPFARPGYYRMPQPMMRAVPDAVEASEMLAAAIKAELGEGFVTPVHETKPTVDLFPARPTAVAAE